MNLRSLACLVCLTLSGCAGSPPTELGDDTDCPDISGSYCAVGERWQAGETELTESRLARQLGFEDGEILQQVDKVVIEGARNRSMTVKLYSGEHGLAHARLHETELRCGPDRVVFRIDSLPWVSGMGGPFPVIAVGGSGGWRLLHRDERGALRVLESVRTTGLLYLAIPLSWKEESWMRFRPTARGCGP